MRGRRAGGTQMQAVCSTQARPPSRASITWTRELTYSTQHEFMQHAAEMLEACGTDLWIDLTLCEYLSEEGLDCLVALQRLDSRAGRRVHVRTAPGSQPRRKLSVTRLDWWLE